MRSLCVLLLLYLVCSSVEAGHDDDYDDDYDSNSPSDGKYDFIVVGTGAAGSVVATRLAQHFPHKDVLVIEGGVQGQRNMGGTDYVQPKSRINAQTGQLELDPIPWTRYDVPGLVNTIQNADYILNNTWGINRLNNSPLPDQGKVIGGNMVINGMTWFRPFNYSFDAWNLPGYRASDLWPLFKKIENATGTRFGNDTNNHGTSGPIKVSPPNFYGAPASKFMAVLVAAGFTDAGDPNDGNGNKSGIVVYDSNTRNGVRDSSSVAYLATQLAMCDSHRTPKCGTQPPTPTWPPTKECGNLHFVSGCTVTRVLFKSKTASGVECVDYCGKVRRYDTQNDGEVILSAGPFGSPKILMNSGIGPNSILTAFDKPKRVINEMIGQKMMSQLRYGMTYSDPTLPTPNFFAIPGISTQYMINGAGLLGVGAGVYVYLKVNASHPTNDVYIQSIMGTAATPDVFATTFPINIGLTYAQYRDGTLNLTSSDPLANTSWNAHAFENDEDVTTMALGVLRAREIMGNWTNATEIFPGPSVNNLTAIKASIKQKGNLSCHFSGSVPIGSTTDYPLDLKMKVRGVKKLRVVDASVMHAQLSNGMQAPAAMIGEKGALLIIADH